MKIAVKTLENKDAGEVTLDANVFGVEVKDDILHRIVHWQLNKRRSGNHSTKGVSEVSGTGKKPWKQKGTGRARQGSMRSPQFVGGAVIFGPKPRSHATDLPKKLRALGLRMALSLKSGTGKLVVLDDAKPKDHKTKAMASALTKMGVESALFVTGKEVDANFARATANLPKIDVLPSQGANVYDILRRDTLFLTKEAVADLTERLKD
jgi:large subunit ribosomal protein L4